MLGQWEGKERSLIPPDEPKSEYETVEKGEKLTRLTYRDDAGRLQATWGLNNRNRCLSEHEQDQFEDAYEMGAQAARAQISAGVATLRREAEQLREMAYAQGVVDTAKLAYGGKRNG